MKREQAISALDDAAAQRIGNLFQVFISNMISDPANAPKEFMSGIGITMKAHASARAMIEALPE